MYVSMFVYMHVFTIYYSSYYQKAGVKCTDSSKLTRKQLNKLACRLTKAYGLNIGNDESIEIFCFVSYW